MSTTRRGLDLVLRRALVEVEESAGVWPTGDFADLIRVPRPSLDPSIPDPMVIPLAVVERRVLGQRMPQCPPPTKIIRSRNSLLIDRTNLAALA